MHFWFGLRQVGDAIHLHTFGEVLGVALPNVVKAHREFAAHLIVDLLGQQNSARFRHTLKSGGQVDALAKQIFAIHHHIPQVNANAEVERSFGIVLQVAQLALHLNCALHSLNHRRKFRDQTIACGICDPAVMAGDEFFEYGARCFERPEASLLIQFHHTAVASGVCCKNGCQLPLNVGGHIKTLMLKRLTSVPHIWGEVGMDQVLYTQVCPGFSV